MAEANNLPTLTYFGFHAKGDPIRMLLWHKGVAFNNKLISREEFAETKATLPAGQVPIW